MKKKHASPKFNMNVFNPKHVTILRI